MIHGKKACFKTLTSKFRYVRTWILTSTSWNMYVLKHVCGSSHIQESDDKTNWMQPFIVILFCKICDVPWGKKYYCKRLTSKFRYKIYLNFDVKYFEKHSISYRTSHMWLKFRIFPSQNNWKNILRQLLSLDLYLIPWPWFWPGCIYNDLQEKSMIQDVDVKA